MHSGLTRTVYTSPYIPQDISHLNLVCDLRGCRRVKTHLSGTQKPRGLHASTKAPREPAPPDGDRTVPSQLRAQQYLEASGNITACSAQVLHSQGCQEQGCRSAAVTRVCIRINLGKSSSPLPGTCLKLGKKRTCLRDKGRALPLPVFRCGGSSPLFYFVPTSGDADLSHDGSRSQSALSPLPTINSSFGFANFRWQEPTARSTFTFRPQTPAQVTAPSRLHHTSSAPRHITHRVRTGRKSLCAAHRGVSFATPIAKPA